MEALTSQEINLALIVLGGLFLGLALISGILKERLFISEPLVALGVGVLLSSKGLGWLNLAHWGNPEGILEQAARIAIAIQVMGVALRLPKLKKFHQRRILGILLGLVMPLMWFASSAIVGFILGVPFWLSLLIGAVITPTDPVVASSVVTGKLAEEYLPERIRNAISAESAANDGLGYPFVFLPILMLTRAPGEAVVHWLSQTLLWEVGGAIVIGSVMGFFAGKFLIDSERKQTLDKQSFLTYTISLSLLVLGAVKLIGSDGILAVFAAGIAFNARVGDKEQAEEEGVQESIDHFFTLYIFVLLGLIIPWEGWFAFGWRGIGIAIAILALRRLPIMLALRPILGGFKALPDALFMGWFGPIGAAAIFYSLLAQKETGIEEPWIIGSLVVCFSIVVHGITAIPFSKWYNHQSRASSRSSNTEFQ